jgi:cell division protein FtsB
MSAKQLLSNKPVLLLLVGLLVLLSNVKYRQWQIQRAIEKEKRILTEQADLQQKKRNELSESLSYLNSNSFKERVARQQLGLKKEGEVVYNFTENSSIKTDRVQEAANENKTNIQKWWEYFVHND